MGITGSEEREDAIRSAGASSARTQRGLARTRTHTRTHARTRARTLSLLQEELALLNSARPSVGFTFMRSMSECAYAVRQTIPSRRELRDVREAASPGADVGRSLAPS